MLGLFIGLAIIFIITDLLDWRRLALLQEHLRELEWRLVQLEDESDEQRAAKEPEILHG